MKLNKDETILVKEVLDHYQSCSTTKDDDFMKELQKLIDKINEEIYPCWTSK